MDKNSTSNMQISFINYFLQIFSRVKMRFSAMKTEIFMQTYSVYSICCDYVTTMSDIA